MPGLGSDWMNNNMATKWLYSQHTSADQTPIPWVPVASPGLKTEREGVKSGRSDVYNLRNLGLSYKANKCSDTGTGDLGVLTTHEISFMGRQHFLVLVSLRLFSKEDSADLTSWGIVDRGPPFAYTAWLLVKAMLESNWRRWQWHLRDISLDCARWRKDGTKIASELAHHHRASVTGCLNSTSQFIPYNLSTPLT